MNYSGMSGVISLGTDRMAAAIREELQLSVPCDINLKTCEAYVPTGNGSQTYCHRLSVLDLAPALSRTAARRLRFGVRVWEGQP